MMTDESNADINREARLVGGGKGSGLPLPLAFGAVAQELMGRDYASFDDLTEVIKDALNFKEERVLGVWHEWPELTRDILEQLEHRDIIHSMPPAIAGTRRLYQLSEDFKPNRSYTVLPKADIRFVVWDKKHREMRGDDTEFEAELRGLLARFQGMGGRVNPDVMDLMQQALAIFDGVDLPEEDKPRPRRPAPPTERRLGLVAHLRRFWDEHPPVSDWFTNQDIADDWSAANPDQEPLKGNKAGSIRRETLRMEKEGLLEVRTVATGKNGGEKMFRRVR